MSLAAAARTFNHSGVLTTGRPHLSLLTCVVPDHAGTSILDQALLVAAERTYQGGHCWVPSASYHGAVQTLHLCLWDSWVRWFNMVAWS